MRKCEHDSIKRLITRNDRRLEAAVCNACGHWLPLGPADDTPDDTPEVLVERMAAEVAADTIERKEGYPGDHWTFDVRLGWARYELGINAVPETPEPGIYRDAVLVGYLARAIVRHDEEVRGER